MPALQDSIDAIRIAAAAADRMKATDIVAFDVTEPLAITDAMLIASASNERQVLAVAEEIEKDLYLKAGKRQPRSREGLTEGQWVLLDYGDFVIHVMHQESREYYRLERLWKDWPEHRPAARTRRGRAEADGFQRSVIFHPSSKRAFPKIMRKARFGMRRPSNPNTTADRQ